MRIIDADAFDKRLEQAEIEATKNKRYVFASAINTIRGNLANAPTIESQIIRCKDCRWWDKSEDSPFGYCMAMKHGYMTANWEIGIYRRYKGDFYCADAERRTDEKAKKN